MGYNIIFDIDQTIVDSSCAKEDRDSRNWPNAYEKIESGLIKPYEGIVELIIDAANYGHKICFVSSSQREYCQRILDKIGLGSFHLIAYHDTPQHKPDPEPYLATFSKPEIGFNMYEPIVIVGDSVNDIKAAHKLYHIPKPDGQKVTPTVFSFRAMWGVSQDDYNSEDHSRNDAKPYMIALNVRQLRDFLFYEWPIKTDDYGNSYCFNYYPTSRSDYTDGYHDYIAEGVQDCYKNGNSDIFFIQNGRQPNQKDFRSPLFMEKWGIQFLSRFITEKMNEKHIENPNMVGVLLVPSSREGEWCKILKDSIIPKACELTGACNCYDFLYRHTTREPAHLNNERASSYERNVRTIKIRDNHIAQLQALDLLIIVDDITTSGSSFKACAEVVKRDCGVKDKAICVALAKTIHFNFEQARIVEPNPMLRENLNDPGDMIYKYKMYSSNQNNNYHSGFCTTIRNERGYMWKFATLHDLEWYAPIGVSRCEHCQNN